MEVYFVVRIVRQQGFRDVMTITRNASSVERYIRDVESRGHVVVVTVEGYTIENRNELERVPVREVLRIGAWKGNLDSQQLDKLGPYLEDVIERAKRLEDENQ